MTRALSILFSPSMVRVLLAGTKSQTRRALPQAQFHRDCVEVCRYSDNDPTWVQRHGADGSICGKVAGVRFAAGDLLYVREAWRASSAHDGLPPRDIPKGDSVEFAADPERIVTGRLRAGMHLPRWASRLTLEVTNVRVERLQSISEADAIAEGVHFARFADWAAKGEWYGDGKRPTLVAVDDPRGLWEAFPDADCAWKTATEAYEDLWSRINGSDSWSANPFVAAYTFAVHHRNIDEVLAERPNPKD